MSDIKLSPDHERMLGVQNERDHLNTVDSKIFNFDKFAIGSDFALHLDKVGRPERWELKLEGNERKSETKFMCCNRNEDEHIDFTDFRTIKKLE